MKPSPKPNGTGSAAAGDAPDPYTSGAHRTRIALVFLGGYALATTVGYLLPIVIRSTVEAVSAAFVLGIIAAAVGAAILERLDV